MRRLRLKEVKKITEAHVIVSGRAGIQSASRRALPASVLPLSALNRQVGFSQGPLSGWASLFSSVAGDEELLAGIGRKPGAQPPQTLARGSAHSTPPTHGQPPPNCQSQFVKQALLGPELARTS